LWSEVISNCKFDFGAPRNTGVVMLQGIGVVMLQGIGVVRSILILSGGDDGGGGVRVIVLPFKHSNCDVVAGRSCGEVFLIKWWR
jgi:hypothetical protein